MVKEKKYSPDLGLGVRLKTIILLRSIAVVGQLLTCIIIGNFLLFNLPLIEVYSTRHLCAFTSIVPPIDCETCDVVKSKTIHSIFRHPCCD